MPLPTPPRFYFNAQTSRGDIQPFAGGTAAVFTRGNPQMEDGNQDAAALIPLEGKAGVLVIADGMGGHRGGQQASRLAVEILSREIHNARDEALPVREGILKGIQKANDAVMDLGMNAGTTLCVAEIQEKHLASYHVGDSMILITGGKGKLIFQNIPHSPVGYAVEAGMLSEEEAMQHAERHLISNMVGSSSMRIEIGPPMRLKPYDTLILASDGLGDNLHSEEIINGIRKGGMRRIVSQLALVCQKRMITPETPEPSKPDDLTFIIFRRGRKH